MSWAVVLALQAHVRQRVGAAATMAVACGAAATVLFSLGVATGTPLGGWPGSTWALLAAAVVGPQLLGHQGFAWSLRWVPPSTVASLALLEPVGATILAAILLDERPEPSAVVGGVLVLVGVAVFLRSSTNVSPGCTATSVG
jgi:drug/metabolite transporter (DMT)-like permease